MNSNQTSIDLVLKKYDVITELIEDKITKLEAIKKLDISDNYIYPLINKYEPGNSICYLNKKIGIPINVKVTNELEKEICQKFITYCKTLKNKPIVVVGRPQPYFAITNDNQILYMKKKVKVSTYIKANQQIQVKYRGKLYDCIIADEKTKKKYSYKIEKKRTTVYRQERYNLWINDKFYHLIDNDNNVVKIEINDSVCKVYDENSKLLYVTKNGHPYAHVQGKAKVDPVSEHIVIDYKTSVINYDSSIKLNNNTYFLKGQGKQVVFPAGQKVEVVVENGYPTYIRHEKMLITLHEKDIIDIRLLLPKSKHCTHKTFCADNTELNIME